ncbi:MAG: glycerol-3-phosphate 1-O-acyltransferase PlsY [Dehalococcoidia bacterium]|nr:glycerol-3-phosphate 1-O-acyltransferase PlsY [Chloroflexota bacterium]MCK4221700.1 glycerol-3-phosphate 1-O-acyltransferase PlsY [Dehalococcoidia bacterium]MCK4262736.1 glycerol-3-phosphate 1-O-acyltransferase PlsY [Dehalococcoidia bacterium]
MMVARFLAVVIMAYLIGSIPFGLIIGKVKSGVDIRKHGSGKTGATNVMRTVGTKFGILTIVLDVVKAAVAVLLAGLVIGDGLLTVGGIALNWEVAQVMAGMAAIAGHNWPVFARFRGGRGVTASFGTLFAIYPPAGVLGAEVLAISALRSRHMSLGSVLGAVAAWCLLVPLTIHYEFPPIYLAYCLAVVVLLVYQHRDNIRRLRRGTERKLW